MASRTRRSSHQGDAGAQAVAAALDRFVSVRLAAVLPRQRWFGGKGRRIASVSLLDAVALGERAPGAWLTLLAVAFDEGPHETYCVPLHVRTRGAATAEVLGRLAPGGEQVVVDPFDDARFCRALLAAFEERATLPTRRGSVRFVRGAALPPRALEAAAACRRLAGEQSNTSVVYADALILKVFRKLEPGINPEYEMTGFLTTRARLECVPHLLGAAEYAGSDGQTMTLAVLHRFVVGRDGWRWVLGHLERLRDVVAARAKDEALDAGRLDRLVRDSSATLLAALRRLGGLTGRLHAALASDLQDGAFAPAPISPAHVAEWTARIEHDLECTLTMLRGRVETLDARARDHVRALLGGQADLRVCVGGLETLAAAGCHSIRIHGDYHLGQTLRTENDFVILDFEGEPARPLAERRAKHTALRDVAGMLRSLDYAAATALGDAPTLAAAGNAWRRLASDAFLEGYLREVSTASVRLVPAPDAGLARALAALELDKALYEVRYEIDNRPTWVGVPLCGLRRLRDRAASWCPAAAGSSRVPPD